MRKHLTIFLLQVILYAAYTKVYTVKIGFGSQYITPHHLEVLSGDTVRFVNYGSFNTTTSLVVPSNAKNWDIDLKAFKSHFDLRLDVEGFYEFHSQTHPLNKGGILVKSSHVPQKPYLTQNTHHDYFDFYIGYNLSEEVEIKVYDLLGKLLIEKKVVLKSGKGQFYAKHMERGIYFFKVYQDIKQVFFYKFIKE